MAKGKGYRLHQNSQQHKEQAEPNLDGRASIGVPHHRQAVSQPWHPHTAERLVPQIMINHRHLLPGGRFRQGNPHIPGGNHSACLVMFPSKGKNRLGVLPQKNLQPRPVVFHGETFSFLKFRERCGHGQHIPPA